jgi:hypothetical protein
MALIDRLMPGYDVSEVHRARILASPESTYRAARNLDLARSRTVRALVAARGIPLVLKGRRPRPRPSTLSIDDLLGAGFVWLGEDPGVEFVLGVVGAFWRPTGGVLRVEPQDFESFDRPGCAKAAWNFRVVAVRATDRSVVTTETRVMAPDQTSRRKFLLYWAAVGPFSGLIRRQALGLVKAEAEREIGRT